MTEERSNRAGDTHDGGGFETRFWEHDEANTRVAHWSKSANDFEHHTPISVPVASVGPQTLDGPGLNIPVLVRFFPAENAQDALDTADKAALFNKVCKLHGRKIPDGVPRGDDFRAAMLRDGRAYTAVLTVEADWQVARLKAQAHDPECLSIIDRQAKRLGWGSREEVIREVEWAREARKREAQEKRELFERQMQARKGTARKGEGR